MSRGLLLALIGALLLLLGACRADFTVALDVNENGSGTVTVTGLFDAEAARQVDDFATALRTDDLVDAGWELADPVTSEDGSIALSMTKRVPSAGDWSGVLDEIAGPDVFVDVDVFSSQEFARRSQTASFGVDLSAGWELLSDPGVADLFDGEPFGVPLVDLTGGATADEAAGVTITTSVSADDSDSPTAAISNPRFDDPAPTQVLVSATSENSFAVLLRWIGFALLSLLVLSLFLAGLGIYLEWRSERNRPEFEKPEPLSARIPQLEQAAGVVSATSPSDLGPVRLIVLNALPLLYSRISSRDAMEAFVAHNKGGVSAAELSVAWNDVIRGRSDTAEFWQRCGLEGQAAEIDELFVAMRTLSPEASAFVEELRGRRIPVAAITDDTEAWSALTRSRDGLLDMWPWICSAAIGDALPSLGSLDRLRRDTGVAYEHCLYVDNEVENLDAAASLGMRTVCVSTSRDVAMGRHAVVPDLSHLFARRS